MKFVPILADVAVPVIVPCAAAPAQAKSEYEPISFKPKSVMDAVFDARRTKGCGPLAPREGACDLNQFYFNVSRMVRAKDTLARAAATASQAKGR